MGSHHAAGTLWSSEDIRTGKAQFPSSLSLCGIKTRCVCFLYFVVNASHLVSEKQLCGTICVEHILGWGWGFAVNTPEMTQGLRTFEWKWRRPRISKSTNRLLSHGGTRYKTNNKETTGHIFGMHRHQFVEMTLPLHRSLGEALQEHVWLASTPCARTH